MKQPIQVKPDPERSISDQVYDELRERILSGQLSAGERLPSPREMQQWISAGICSIQSALERLQAEGLVIRKRRLGTFVKDVSEAGAMPVAAEPAPGDRAAAGSLAVLALLPVTADMENPEGWRHRQLIQAFEDAIADHGGKVEILPIPRSLDDLARMQDVHAALPRVNAIFLECFWKIPDAVVQRFIDFGLPVVATDYRGSLRLDTVNDDWGWSMRLAVEHLIELGHDRIALACYAPNDTETYAWVDERREVFLQLARLRHLPIGLDDVYCLPLLGKECSESPQPDDVQAVGRRLADRIFDSGRSYTAIVAVNDYVAASIVECATSRGLCIPEDLSVVGFDNRPIAGLVGLTTVRPAAEADGREAARLLMHRFRNPEREVVQHILNRPRLYARRSTAAVAPRTEAGTSTRKPAL